ncbi:MAG: MmgE/PrpD family protein [Dehalococcoidales bacterium]|nr:MmgE/PrpD family protein [Dehalococcoidales bacterium]
MNKTRILARNLVKVRYQALPEKLVEVTKMCILDTIGVMLAATTQGEACREVVELAKEGGGREESSIIGFGGKVPAWMAAFANGALTHPLDYDDMHVGGHVHPTAASLPAALAIAESLSSSGRDLITAVALASDLVCRLGMCATKDQAEYGWLTPPLLGFFGAAAAAGKLLKLSEDQMVSALAFSFHQATGSFEMASGANSIFRAIYEAFIGKAGVLSALMAKKNLAGGEDVLEGKYGLFNLHFQGEYDPKPLTDRLGEHFEGVNTSLKPWPSCGGSYPFIDATLNLVKEKKLEPENVAEIMLVVNAFGQEGCEPLAGRRAPKKSVDAKYSVPFCVAHALVHQKVDMASFSKKGLEDPAVLRAAQKINYTRDLMLNGEKLLPGTMVVKTLGGETYTKRVDAFYGSPEKPMAENDRIAKIRDCASFSIKPMPERKVDKLIQMTGELDSLDNVGQLIQLLT